MEFEKLKQIVAEILRRRILSTTCVRIPWIFTRSFRKLKRRLKLKYRKKRQKRSEPSEKRRN